MVGLLDKYLPIYRQNPHLIQMHKQSYLDLFQKDKLAYLSPHADVSEMRINICRFELKIF